MGDKNEEKVEKVRKSLICSNCTSSYTYTNKSGILVCRKCGHREEN